jgi:hypothetical protein
LPSEGRVPSTGLGSITLRNDPMLYNQRPGYFYESPTQDPLKRRAPLTAQIPLYVPRPPPDEANDKRTTQQTNFRPCASRATHFGVRECFVRFRSRLLLRDRAPVGATVGAAEQLPADQAGVCKPFPAPPRDAHMGAGAARVGRMPHIATCTQSNDATLNYIVRSIMALPISPLFVWSARAVLTRARQYCTFRVLLVFATS